MFVRHDGKTPRLGKNSYVAENAYLIGDVSLGEGSSVWFGAVLRADINKIEIGDNTNVQDLSVLHVPEGLSLKVGDDVTIGHRSIVHGCMIGNRVLIGMGSVIMDDAEISDFSIVGAASLVTEGKKFPPRSLILGSPAKFIRELTDDEVKLIKASAEHYAELALRYIS